MYRINEVLTPEERLAAMRLGAMKKLASMGIGPKKFVRLTKTAAKDGGDWLKEVLLMAFGLGIPVGVASYALSRGTKPKTRNNLNLKRRLDAYNDIVAQYNLRSQKDKEEEEEDRKKEEAAAELASSAPVNSSGFLTWPGAETSSEKVAFSPLGGGILSGLIGGGAVAAVQALISDRVEANRQKKKQEERESDSVSPDTVVLYLNKKKEDAQKTAEIRSSGPCTTLGQAKPAVSSSNTSRSAYFQPRNPDGTYASPSQNELEGGKPVEKKAVARMFDNGVWLASAIAAAPLGYLAIKKLSDKLEENRLKAQVAAAQEEYVDMLSGGLGDKVAEDFMSALSPKHFGLFEKTAGIPSLGDVAGGIAGSLGAGLDRASAESPGWRAAENLGSVGVAAGILSALAAAYITNKALHKNYDAPEPENEEDEDRKRQVVKRVLFRSGSTKAAADGSPAGENVFEITPETALTAIYVLRDCIADSDPMEKKAAWYNPISWLSPEKQRYVGDHIWPSQGISAVEGMNPEEVKAMMTPEEVRNVLRAYQRDMLEGKDIGTGTKGATWRASTLYPEQWIHMMGSDEFRPLRDVAVDWWLDKQMNDRDSWYGKLQKIPLLGGWIRNLMKWWAQHMKGGRAKVLYESLIARGVSPQRARYLARTANYSMSGTGWSMGDKYDDWMRGLPTEEPVVQGQRGGNGINHHPRPENPVWITQRDATKQQVAAKGNDTQKFQPPGTAEGVHVSPQPTTEPASLRPVAALAAPTPAAPTPAKASANPFDVSLGSEPGSGPMDYIFGTPGNDIPWSARKIPAPPEVPIVPPPLVSPTFRLP